MKIQKEYEEAEKFISSLRLAHVEVRKLEKGELEFIYERARELHIPNVKEYVEYIKANKKIINKKPKEVK
ncbi:MAG: hypothetical protein ACRDDH_18255 [Cetobacterium sp.]|uniref:hypothetical protein n=1 Tax=Cetobacterium sp. TaxID=2071632 RepID=UPI003EE743E2